MDVNKCFMKFHVLPFPKKEATVVFKKNKFHYFSLTCIRNSLLEKKFMNTNAKFVWILIHANLCFDSCIAT